MMWNKLKINPETDCKPMDPKQKGQIFHLWDNGKSVKEIVKLTNWSEQRVFILIDAIRGNSFWRTAKALWLEEQETNDDKPRKSRTPRTNKLRTEPKRKPIETPNILDITKRVPKHRFKSNNVRNQRSEPAVRTNNDQPVTGGTIVKSLKKLKDYQGD